METSEVAAMLSMSTSRVYREASKPGLKGYKLGRGKNAKVLHKRTEVFKWLEQQKIHQLNLQRPVEPGCLLDHLAGQPPNARCRKGKEAKNWQDATNS
ncbi:helix-turn-helix domain-containing protein [Streptomyces sp. NK15101]|uniref:helix-turn-helix domain-containing protein n=1 Tax=Streptomyces sp. NK15101 TaxID=2873261 RepID=UPI001CED7795|nr:helix-turn-helix domain-containing protein [Streptomyces sp. NK15101]